jgi:hypothetical protein
MLDEDADEAVQATAPIGVSHIGFIAFDIRNQALVIEPEDKPYGVTATLPRVRVKPDEPAVMTLTRCLKERVGWRTTSVFPIHNVWITENSSPFFYTGMIKDNDEPPNGKLPRSIWCSVGEARSRIKSSKNLTTRRRDLAALDMASRIERSLYRRVLLMVRQLHRMGFARLRAATWMHQNGYIKPPGHWSCSVVPSIVMDSEDGAKTDGHRMNQLREILKVIQHHDPFQTSGSHRPFGWTDACFDTPGQLAEKFFQQFRDLCFVGWGSDPEYEEWYDQMLELTAPNGVCYPVGQGNVVTAWAASDCMLRPPPSAAR